MKDVEVKNTDMPDWLFEKVVKELSDLDYSGRVSLFEINEPLLDEKIVDRIKTVKREVPKSWQCVSTNGDLLTSPLAVELIDAGLDFLAVNSYSYAAFRKMKLLRKEIPERIKERIIHTERFDPKFAKDNRGGNIKAISELKEPLKEPCSRINHVLYIKPDGNVVSCFGDFFSKNIMGNVKEQSLVDIWFGERFSSMREHLDRGDRTANELCSKCNISEKGDFLESYSVLPPLARRSNTLRAVIVGESSSSRMFLPYLSKHSRISYIISASAVKDELLQDQLHSVIDQKGETVFADNYPRVLMDPTIDFVFIANQNKLHFETAMKALEAGKHVLLEKPLALSMEDCEKLIEFSRSRSLTVGGIFQFRFLGIVRIIKAMLAENALGEILFVNCRMIWQREPSYYSNGRGTWDSDGGGVLMKQAIHCLDLLIYLVGSPVSWHAIGTNSPMRQETEDTALLSMKLRKGFATLAATVAGSENLPPEIEIIGTNGHVIFDLNDKVKYWKSHLPLPVIEEDGVSIMERQIVNFIQAVNGREDLVVTPEECLKSLSVIFDVYKRDEFVNDLKLNP